MRKQEMKIRKQRDKEGGVLTIARLSDADNLDPHFITNIPSASVVYHKVYENLVQRDKTWILSRC